MGNLSFLTWCIITANEGGSAPFSVLPATSTSEVKQMIKVLDMRFKTVKYHTKKCIEMQNIAVDRVADVLTSLSPDDDDHHKMFLEDHVKDFATAVNHSELFGTMNFHWNYLDPSLLDNLVRNFDLDSVKAEMETYKSDLQKFRMKTPLTLFCRTQKRKRIRLSPDFQEIIAEFDWENDATLEHVERFRQEYASHYKLHEFAMMIAQVRPGSFIVTWFIPKSVVEKLQAEVPRAILQKYLVSGLDIAGICIYRSPKSQKVSVTDV